MHNNAHLIANRFYSPGLGRWINRDPIAEAGGLNLYAMVHNNPTNAVDGRGLAEGDWWDVRTLRPRNWDFSGTSWHDIECGWYAGADGLNPFGDPYKDMGYYNPNSYTSQWSHGLGTVSQQALIAAIPVGSLSAGAETVLYSGRGTKLAAQQSGLGKVLADTVGGKVLNGIEGQLMKATGKKFNTKVWDVASAIFVANSKGPIYVFTKYPRARSVWLRVEKPLANILRREIREIQLHL